MNTPQELIGQYRDRVIVRPRMEVVARTVFVGHSEYLIAADGDDAIRVSAFAAKGCYDSFGINGRANAENQRQCISERHGSVLEHVSFSLFIEGVSRGLSLELNRHRISISQRSTRYTAEGEAKIVLNPTLADIWERLVRWSQLADVVAMTQMVSIEDFSLLHHALTSAGRSLGDYQSAVELYMAMAEERFAHNVPRRAVVMRKWARGQARDLLPHALETRGTWTANLRAWRWILESRSHPDAEGEIRRWAHMALQELRTWAPLFFEDFEVVGEKDGIPIWKPTYSKV